MTCLVTFSAATSGGAVRANAKLVFVATGPAIRAAGGTVVPRDAIEALADASGVGSVALRPGPYVLQMVTPLGLQAVEITVPVEETADLWTLVDAVDIPLPPESLQLAQASAVLAASERTQAAQERAAAELARQEAEAARDASFTNATVYPDIVTGREAVVDDAQFTVLEVGAVEAVRYRRDSSSTQTELARFPVSSRVTQVEDIAFVRGSSPGFDEEWRELTLDASGRPVRGVDKFGYEYRARDGVMMLDRDTAHGVVQTVTHPLVANWSTVTLDAANRVVRGVDRDGVEYVAVGGVLAPDPLASAQTGAIATPSFDPASGLAIPALDDAVDTMIIVLGQSYAEGFTDDAGEVTISTAAQHPGFALMPSVGPLAKSDAWSSYADLREIMRSGGAGKETICSGMADAIMRRCQAAFGRKPRMVFGAAARGATRYWDNRAGRNGLKRGSVAFGEMEQLILRSRDASRVAGRRLVVAAVVILHGESDGGFASQLQYERYLHQWQGDVEVSARRITGQIEPVLAYVSQTNRPTGAFSSPIECTIAQAQLAASLANPRIRCIGPLGAYPASVDAAHMTPTGYRTFGAYVGAFIAVDLFGAGQLPLYAHRARWINTTQIALEFTLPVALEADDSRVAISTLGAGLGVDFTDGSGSPPTVTAVTASGSTVTVTLSAAPTGRAPRVWIASRPTGAAPGPVNGLRSGIRSADVFETDSLTSVAAYHWACTQTLSL